MACNSPVTVEIRKGVFLDVPCRQCMGCRIMRRNGWERRLRMECAELARKGLGSTFLTLTYADTKLPLRLNNSPKIGSNVVVPTLNKIDVVKWKKRFFVYLHRHTNFDVSKIKMYLVGEYGSATNRPHYHAIVCGLSPKQLSPIVKETWKFGLHDCRSVENGSIRYVLKYMDKQQSDFVKYESENRLPPFRIKDAWHWLKLLYTFIKIKIRIRTGYYWRHK